MHGRAIYCLPSDPPRLVERYFDLWAHHPQKPDPLTEPLSWRLSRHSDEIPF